VADIWIYLSDRYNNLGNGLALLDILRSVKQSFDAGSKGEGMLRVEKDGGEHWGGGHQGLYKCIHHIQFSVGLYMASLLLVCCYLGGL